jgi:chemotaxis protein MotB
MTMRNRISVARLALMLVGPALVLGSVGCGVDKKKHAAEVKKAKQLAKKLGVAKGEAKTAKTQLTELKSSADKAQTRIKEAEKSAKKARNEAMIIKKNFGAKIKASEKEIKALTKARVATDRRAKLLTKLEGTFKKLIDDGQISLRVSHGRMVLKMRSKVLFLSGSAKLLNYGKRTLKRIAKVLMGIEGNHFQVAGHTDSKPIKSKQFNNNWELSVARSSAVTMYLLEQGVPGEMLSIAGFAEFQAVASNKRAWGRKMNRRIEITLMPSIPRQLVKKQPKRRRRKRRKRK